MTKAGETAAGIGAWAALLGFQVLGELLARGLKLPVPGPVVGMALLWGALARWPGLHARIRATCHALIRNMAILFVPAGVGLMTLYGPLREHAGLFFWVVTAGTWATGLTAAGVFAALQARAPQTPVKAPGP